MSEPYIVTCRFPDDLKIVLACIKNGLIAVLSHDIRKLIEKVVDINNAHVIFLEIPPALPVKSYGQVDLLAVQDLKELTAVLMEHIECAVCGIVIDTNLKTGSLCILVIFFEFAVFAEFAVVVDHGSEVNEFASCSLDLIKIDIALISGYVDAIRDIAVRISCHEVAVCQCLVRIGAASATAATIAGLINLDRHLACLSITGIVSQSNRYRITSHSGSIYFAVNLDIYFSITVIDITDMLLDIEFTSDLNAYRLRKA